MKIKILLILAASLLFAGCSKNKNNSSTQNEQRSIKNVTFYLKNLGAWGYKNEKDLDKNFNNIDRNNKKYFNFGNSFLGIQMKNTAKNIYYLVKEPDNEKYWLDSSALTEKFIVINKNDVSTYLQPDPDSKTSIKLQPGDFGCFLDEHGEWILVDFYALRPYEKNGQKVWVGKKWINEGYITDINAAMQAYYLYLSYYFTFVQKIKNKTKAIEFANKSLDVNNGQETDITFVVKNFLNELQSGKYF